MKTRTTLFALSLLLALLACAGPGRAQGRNDWLVPFPAFTIGGNLSFAADMERVFRTELARQKSDAAPAAKGQLEGAPSVVFIGNSFLFGSGSAVRFFRANTVTDLNGSGIGGVPALFKCFTQQAGRDFAVSHETSGGKNFDYHVENKADVLGRAWDYAVALG